MERPRASRNPEAAGGAKHSAGWRRLLSVTSEHESPWGAYMEPERLGGVWVCGEQRLGRVADVAFELTCKARSLADRLGSRVTVAILGSHIEDCSNRLIALGADVVLFVDDPRLEHYQSDVFVPVLQQLVKEHEPAILLMGATRVGLDLAPALAASLGTGLSAHCVDLDLNEAGQLVQMVPAYGVQCVATIICPKSNPQMATVKPGAFECVPGEGRKGRALRLTAESAKVRSRVDIVEEGTVREQGSHGFDTAEALVVGGAGVASPEGWGLIGQLADALHGVVGATRPAVDEGWAGLDQMIGHSGSSAAPKLYVGVGVSGDMLHMIGVAKARVIVAINSDPRAPVFQQADYGIVGDYRAILPILVSKLEGLQSTYV